MGLCKWIKGRFASKPSRPPKMFDFRENRWGHAFNLTGEVKEGGFGCYGFGEHIQVGDQILTATKIYTIVQIHYQHDPPDMFFGRCVVKSVLV